MDKLVELYNEKFSGKMNKSTLSRYENGLQEPIYTVVVNLAKLFNVSVDYLSCADTEPKDLYDTLGKHEKLLIQDYRSLSPQGQKYILQTMDMAKDRYGRNTAPISEYAEIAALGGKNIKPAKKNKPEIT